MLQKYLDQIQKLLIGNKKLTDDEMNQVKSSSLAFLITKLEAFINTERDGESSKFDALVANDDIEGYLNHLVVQMTKIPDFAYLFDAYMTASITDLKYKLIKKSKIIN